MLENVELEKQKAEFPGQIIPFIALFVGVSAIATTAIFIKISVHEMSVNTTMFNRLWIGSAIFLVGNLSQKLCFKNSNQESIQELKQNSSYQLSGIWLLATVSIVYLSGRFLWIFALNETTVSNGIILNSITPLFTTLGAWLFLKQSFGSKFIVGLVIALIGSITLGIADLHKVDINPLGDVAVLLSCLFFAASLLILEKVRVNFSSSDVLLWRCVIGTMLMLPIVLLFEDRIFPTSRLGWIAVISMAAIGEMIGHGLTVYSIKYISSSVVSVLMLLEPIIAIILAWIIFSERLDSLTWLSLVLVLIGVFLAKDDVDSSADKMSSATE